jgi:excisionase family DNA binding protein
VLNFKGLPQQIVSSVPFRAHRKLSVSIDDEEAQVKKNTNDSGPDGELLRVNTFCDALAIKESTGRKWLTEKRIASVKVGPRLVRIPRSELQRIVDEGFRPAK